MRLKHLESTRNWIALTVAALAVLPGSAAVAAPPTAPTPTRLPHVVGGYVPSPTRVAAKAPDLGGVRANAVLPESVDLRQYAPPVGDQGQIGSCVAWSIAHGIMGYYANRTGGVGAPYAPLFLYMRNVAPGGAPHAGLYPDAVLANAKSAGVDTQADYWQGTTNYQTPPTAAQIANATNYKITGWSRLFNGANQGANAKTAIQQAMASGSPVAIGFDVYSDFMNLRSHTVYNPSSGSSLGGHMVAAFGYDAQGVWIRNSWGTWWGNGGDAKLSWAFVTRVVSGAYTVSGIQTSAPPMALPPTVASLSVAKGTAGTAVTITGAGLAGATAVRFGATSATFSPITSGGVTKLVATAPAQGTGPVAVTVTNSTGTSTASSASTFTYVPPAPAVSALSPNAVSVVGGTTVTLTGTDLTGFTTVKLGTATVAAKAVSSTSLTFVAPARAAGTADVTVTTPSGTSAVSAASRLSYVTPPKPVITTINPSSALMSASTLVTVTGTDLVGATRVTAGAVIVPFVKVSGTTLKVTMPSRAAGSVSLQVTTPGGVSTVNADSTFTYRALPSPAITNITPRTGPTYVRTPVVITGANLDGATKLLVDGVSVAFTKVSGTSLKAILPVHAAGEVNIQVTTAGGVSAIGSDARFGYVAPAVPRVNSLAPSSGSTLISNTVLINGTGLIATSAVTGNGTALSFVKVSDTQVQVSVGKRLTGGPIAVVVTTPGGTSQAVVYTAVAPPVPTITALSAGTGLTYVTTPVTITGTGFDDVRSVTIGGQSARFTRASATQLQITAPKRAAGPVPIVVTTLGGPSSAATFTYIAPPVPAITALATNTGYTNRVSKIGLTGAALTAASKVTSAGVSVPFIVVSDTQLTITLPVRAAGTVEVRVTTPGGTSGSAAFTYLLPPAPVISALTPQQGLAGRSVAVVVTGTALTSVTKLTVGGGSVPFTKVSDTQLRVTVPARPAGKYVLVLTGPGGSSSVGAASGYTYF